MTKAFNSLEVKCPLLQQETEFWPEDLPHQTEAEIKSSRQFVAYKNNAMSTQSSPRKEWIQAALFRCMWSNSSILHHPIFVKRSCCDTATGGGGF